MPDARFRTFVVDEHVMDIRTLESMEISRYRKYIEDFILRLDHHEHLRAQQGEYIIARTPAEVGILINILEDVKASMIEARS